MVEEMEKQKEAEKETDSVDGIFTRPAETTTSHRRAADKRYYTLGNQKKKQRSPVDFSTVSKGTSGATKSRGALMQSLFSQGAPEKTQEERGVNAGGQGQVEALKKALESFSLPSELRWRWSQEDDTDVLERNWTDIVEHSETMSKSQRLQQEALWELIHTEIIYINKLTIITDLVLAALDYVHQSGFLQEVGSAQLFSNLPSILTAHKLFWHEVMCPMLEDVRRTRQPFDPLKLEPGCLQFDQRFTAYLEYCWEEERNVEFTHKQQETNPHFNIFLTWVESHPQCGRMRLGDMQAKPHQRITKYPLLLKSILKTTEDPHTQQALHRMLTSVSQFLDSINDYLQFKIDELALSDLSQRIEGYEMPGMSEEIDKVAISHLYPMFITATIGALSKLLQRDCLCNLEMHMQELCHFDLTRAIRGVEPPNIRKLLMEETMKVRGKKDSKLEVVMLLFTDVLLLTKSQKKTEKLKVVRPPLSLERIRCAVLKDGSSFVLLEVSDLDCAINVYSVSAPSTDSCSLWVTEIHRAQTALETLRKKETITLDELEELEAFTSPSREDIEDTEDQLRGTKRDKEEQEPKETVTVVNGHQDESSILMNERRVTWNHVPLSPPDISGTSYRDSPKASTSNVSHPLLVKIEEGISSQASPSNLMASEPMNFEPVRNKKNGGSTSKNKEKGKRKQDSVSQLQESKTLEDSRNVQTDEENETCSESSRFSRQLKSPRLRRKRPVNFQLSDKPQNCRKLSDDMGITHKNSSSNSDSDGSHSLRRSSISSNSQDTHRVLKLGSLKSNQSVFWNMPSDTSSTDPQTLSEPELPNGKPDQNSVKMPKMKSNRSSSTPELVYQPAHNVHKSVLMPCPSPPPGLDPQLHPSPLQGLLERAKEREKERGTAKREGKLGGNNALSRVNLVSTTPSPSEGERETEMEVAEVFNPQEKSSLLRGRECSVDDIYIERKNSPSTPLGASVDWQGWCFDDDEVLEFLRPSDGLVAWIDQTLSGSKPDNTPKCEEGECSEV